MQPGPACLSCATRERSCCNDSAALARHRYSGIDPCAARDQVGISFLPDAATSQDPFRERPRMDWACRNPQGREVNHGPVRIDRVRHRVGAGEGGAVEPCGAGRNRWRCRLGCMAGWPSSPGCSVPAGAEVSCRLVSIWRRSSSAGQRPGDVGGGQVAVAQVAECPVTAQRVAEDEFPAC